MTFDALHAQPLRGLRTLGPSQATSLTGKVWCTFMECTAMSMRPPVSASSISFVNSPLPPMSDSGCPNTCMRMARILLQQAWKSHSSSPYAALQAGLQQIQ